MSESVFNRQEMKYMIDDVQCKALLDVIGGKLQTSKFAESKIMNLYYDSPDSLLVRRSLDKPVFKEKLRLRSYGRPDGGDPVFLEVKRKYNGVVYKRRIKLAYEDCTKFIQSKVKPEMNLPEEPNKNERQKEQILDEIEYFIKFYDDLEPACMITYDRRSFEAVEDTSLRITFDTGLKYRFYDLDLRKGAYGDSLLEDNKMIMEIKANSAYPLWLCAALEDIDAYKTNFSKYGKAYEYELNRKTEGVKEGGIKKIG